MFREVKSCISKIWYIKKILEVQATSNKYLNIYAPNTEKNLNCHLCRLILTLPHKSVKIPSVLKLIIEVPIYHVKKKVT